MFYEYLQPEFSHLLHFFFPRKLTNQRQLFRILTNRRRVYLHKKKNRKRENSGCTNMTKTIKTFLNEIYNTCRLNFNFYLIKFFATRKIQEIVFNRKLNFIPKHQTFLKIFVWLHLKANWPHLCQFLNTILILPGLLVRYQWVSLDSNQ